MPKTNKQEELKEIIYPETIKALNQNLSESLAPTFNAIHKMQEQIALSLTPNIEAFDKMQEQLASSLAPNIEAFDKMQEQIALSLTPNIEALSKMQEQIALSLAPIQEQIALSLTPNIEALSNIQKQFSDTIKICVENAQKYYITYEIYKKEKLPEELKEYMWILPPELYQNPDSLLGDLTSTVLYHKSHWRYKYNKTKMQRMIDNEIIKALKQNKYMLLDQFINKWSNNKKLFSQERLLILRDCLKVIKQFGKKTSANIVLPTLIAQIDGIWRHLLSLNGVDPDNYYDIYRKKYGQITSKKQIEELENLIDKADKFQDLAYKFLTEILFCDDKNMTTDFYFYRHKIMHGRTTKYNEISNVVKAFFILDFLYRIEEKSTI